jgi:hypothetical protein
MTIATADVSGVPWATPVWFAHDAYAEFLWVSRPDARHSANIADRPQVGIVIFDSTVAVGHARAVYVEGVAGAVTVAHIERSIATYSRRSLAQGGPAWTAQDVAPDAPHRLYSARASAHFILTTGDRRLLVRPDDPEAP